MAPRSPPEALGPVPILPGTGGVHPHEHTNLLGDSSTANNPPAAILTDLASRLNALATCVGAACVR